MTKRKSKIEDIAEPTENSQEQEPKSVISNLILWITNPDNVGTIQVVLALNTVIMSITYWLFQWVYGEDLMSYTMNSIEKNKNAFKPGTETTPTEFAIVEFVK